MVPSANQTAMRIFVTGGTGFIGTHFLRAALHAGHEVLALRWGGKKRRLPLDQEPTWIDSELRSVPSHVLRGCQALVHFAAAGVDPTAADWETTFRVNVVDSLALWRQAGRCGVRRLVISGSCFEYGLSAEKYDFIPPDAPLVPVGPYHASKAAATMAAMGLSIDMGIETIILRPFHVFGLGEAAYRLWPSLRRAALSGEDFPMTRGEQIRDFVPVAQVATEFLLALKDETVQAGAPVVRNVGSGHPRTVMGFAQTWWKEWKAPGALLPGRLNYRRNEIMRFVPLLA